MAVRYICGDCRQSFSPGSVINGLCRRCRIKKEDDDRKREESNKLAEDLVR